MTQTTNLPLPALAACGKSFRPVLAADAASAGMPPAASVWTPAWSPRPIQPSELPDLQERLVSVVTSMVETIATAGIGDTTLSEVGRKAARQKVAAGWIQTIESPLGVRIRAEAAAIDGYESSMRADLERARSEISPLTLARAQAAASALDADVITAVRDAIEKGDQDAVVVGLLVPSWGSTVSVRRLAEERFAEHKLGRERVHFVDVRTTMRDVVVFHLESVIAGLHAISELGEESAERPATAAELIARGNAVGAHPLVRRVTDLGLAATRPGTFAINPQTGDGWQHFTRGLASGGAA